MKQCVLIQGAAIRFSLLRLPETWGIVRTCCSPATPPFSRGCFIVIEVHNEREMMRRVVALTQDQQRRCEEFRLVTLLMERRS
jgi:hypothetical protein